MNLENFRKGARAGNEMLKKCSFGVSNISGASLKKHEFQNVTHLKSVNKMAMYKF